MSEGEAAASPAPRGIANSAAMAARYLAIAIGFTLPISTFLDNVLQPLLLVCWLASGRWGAKYATIRANPVVLAALALFTLLVFGLAWSQGPLSDGLLYLRKYTSLLLIPILVTVFTDPNDRRRGLLALAAAIALTLLLSFALAAGALPIGGLITGVPDDPTVFKKHITQNVFMAFGCLLFAQFARRAQSRNLRLFWAVLAALGAFDVLFLVHGRTGYFVLASLALLFLFEHLRWRGLVAAAVLVVVGFASAYEFSNGFRSRISLAESEVEQWRPGVATDTSVGIRLEFYRNTLGIIEQHPWLGVGTGGFAHVYAERVQGTSMRPTYNPHNQYLLTTAQLGIVGLILLMLVFAQQWRCARRLPGEMDRTLARGLVLTYVIASLFSSPLIDHAESLLFAWLSGLLFAALPPPALAATGKSA
jgi:O-antigen ligase